MEKDGIASVSWDHPHAPTCKPYTRADSDLVEKWLKMSPFYMEEVDAMYPICVLLDVFFLDKNAQRSKEFLDGLHKISTPKLLFNLVARSNNEIYKRANQLLKNQGHAMDPELCVLKVFHGIYRGNDNRDLRIAARTIIKKEKKIE